MRIKRFRVQGSGFRVMLLVLAFFFSMEMSAQCAMCRASLESSSDTSQAEAVNDGIVYLMVIPYVLVGAIGYVIYRSRRSVKSK